MPIPPGYAALAGSERPRPASHSILGPADAEASIGVTIVVRPRPGSPPLPDAAHWQATPPGKRHFPSANEYARTYGAAQADLDAVGAFAAGHGLKVVESHAGRRSVTVHGTAAQMNAAFGVTLNRYEGPTRDGGTHIHHGYDGSVSVPADLAGIVLGVVGLDNRQGGGPMGASGDPPGAKPLSVPAVAAIYGFPNTGAADQTIGVFAQQTAPGVGANYLQADITQYFTQLKSVYPAYNQAPVIQPVSLSVSGQKYLNNPAAVQGLGSNAAVFELTQDICTAATIAQGTTVNVYFTDATEQGWLVLLNRVLQPETEQQPTVVTCSFLIYGSDTSAAIGTLTAPGSPSNGSAVTLMSTALQALAARGINFFYGQGDWGADDAFYVAAGNFYPDGNSYVQYPGTDPSVISCGGTMLGELNPHPPPKYLEWVWSDAWAPGNLLPYNWGATGGGVSRTFLAGSAPYQTAAGIPGATDSAGTPWVGRGVPDIAGMVAYSGIADGVWFYVGGNQYPYSGTSCVAPLYAGLCAVLNSAFGVNIGFLNPTLYQLGAAQFASPGAANPVFNDIVHGTNDSVDTRANLSTAIPNLPATIPPDAPYFSAVPGWDACTGWGSINGTNLLNAIAGLMYTPAFYFQMGQNSFGADDVGVVSAYSDAFSLVLEGFTPLAVMNTAIGPNFTAAGFNALNGVTLNIGPPQFELKLQLSTPQRIIYACSVNFASPPPAGLFPGPGAAPLAYPLTADISVNGQPLSAITSFELTAGADPRFSNVNPQVKNVFYLSQDLRVFTVTPGVNSAPIAGVATPVPSLQVTSNTDIETGAALQYIQHLLNYLNTNYNDPNGVDPFILFPDQSSALSGDSSVTPTSINPASVTPSNPGGTNPFTNYNFAVARVRLTGPANTQTDKNVRVFFRLFATETSDTDYQPTWTYPSDPPGGLPESPLLGNSNPPVTIPFFATGNLSNNADYQANADYPATGTTVNSYPIKIGHTGNAWAYYGCYLNVYQPTNTIKVNNNDTPVSALLPGTHHCVVAQIAFDDAPIVSANGTTAGPENSDKLAQRNLVYTPSDNPGPAAAHRIPQTFDTRPTAALSPGGGDLLDYPDELMIDWGATPVGSVANIYWPQVAAADVLALAKRLYSTHQLSAADANTVQCTVPDGFTYVPIPTGTGQNFAGLFTVDLPQGVRTGQVFTITVRRIATRRADVARVNAAPIQEQGKPMRNWRYIIGSFAVQIPVMTARAMLGPEENTLAIMKWRLEQMAPTNRWYPVLLRYVGLIAGRVDGLGGNAATIAPSPYGALPAKRGHGGRLDDTGKVNGVIYDRFGDFEGFLLLTERGEERSFASREAEIEALVRFAWQERVVITVLTETPRSDRPVSIILRRAPPQPRRWDA